MSDAHPKPPAPGDSPAEIEAPDLADALAVVTQETAKRMMLAHRALASLNECLAAGHMEARFSVVPRGRS